MAPVRHTLLALAGLLAAASGPAAGVQDSIALNTSVSARAIQPGEVVQLDVACACDAIAATATVFGTEASLFRMPVAGRWRGLIGIDLDIAPGTYPIRIAVDRGSAPLLTTTHDLLVTAKAFPTRRLQVAPAFVDPPAAETARILDEARALQAAFAIVTPRAWEGVFHAPLAAKPTGSFGMRSVFNGQPRSPHGGTDFPGPTGTPLAAPAAGSIALARPLFFTGNTVVIDHGLGLFSLLAHLSRLDVKAGESVTQGQIVGLLGATGRVTGPHLHWAVRLNGARVDPLSLIAIAGSTAQAVPVDRR